MPNLDSAINTLSHSLTQILTGGRLPTELELRDGYYMELSERLKAIVGEKDDVVKVEKLENLLHQIWIHIQGTQLDYTRSPNSRITEGLCAIADAIAEYKNTRQKEGEEPVLAIAVLMPGIDVSEYAPNLLVEKVVSCSNTDDGALQEQKRLQDESVTTGKQKRYGNYLVPTTSLKEIIQTYHDRAATIKSLGQRLSTKTISGWDFIFLLQNLNESDRTLICESLKDRLPTIIKSVMDFRDFLHGYDESQRTVVFELVKKERLKSITSANESGHVLENLSASQIDLVCESMIKTQLPTIIKSGEDFRSILQNLNESQRTEVFESVKKQLPKIIRLGWDFSRMLQYLNESQRTEVFELVKEQLPTKIKTSLDFSSVLENLNESQRTEVCKSMIERLPTIIESRFDFANALEHLNESQTAMVCDSIKKNLPTIIESGIESGWRFGQLIHDLNASQIAGVCKSFKEHLLTILQSGEQFGSVLFHLNESQSAEVFKAFKGKLLGLSGSLSAFKKLSPSGQEEIADCFVASSVSAHLNPVFVKNILGQLDLLSKRDSEYSYKGLLSRIGGFSRTEKMTAITKFLQGEQLSQNEISALKQGETGNIFKRDLPDINIDHLVAQTRETTADDAQVRSSREYKARFNASVKEGQSGSSSPSDPDLKNQGPS